MEWIVPLIAAVLLFIFFLMYLPKKGICCETSAIDLFILSLFIYHLGDLFLWSGWVNYEVARRIASVGFYLEIPFLLLLTCHLLPKNRRSILVKFISYLLLIPWVYAIVMIGRSPIVFLEGKGEADENFIYLMILFFVISILFIVINAFRAGSLREDGFGRKLGKRLGWGAIFFTILYLLIFSSIELIGQDLTWLFGIVSVIFALLLQVKQPAGIKE